LRREGFCEAWNAIVQLGLTDDTYTLQHTDSISYAEWLRSYIPEKEKWNEKNIKSRVAKFLDLKPKGGVIERLEWLGLFSDEKIPLPGGTPAMILQNLVERKWTMQPGDNDLIVMRHEFKYTMNDVQHEHTSTLILKGEDSMNTAMAKTVGLPMGIMVKLLLQNELFLTGVHIPVMSQVYEPVLREMEDYNVKFTNEERKCEDIKDEN
jgi:saccharopine dehydrogenase-like NADP-dependent oxidoreductase